MKTTVWVWMMCAAVAVPVGLQGQQGAPSAAPPAASSKLSYEFFRDTVQPVFLTKRPGRARCVTCHASGTPRLQALADGASTWTEAQSRQNFEVWSRSVVPGNPNVSKMLVHPLARSAGGDVFHGGGQHWTSKDDPEWKMLAQWVNGGPTAKASQPPYVIKPRIIQTNAAGDEVHVIDPASNTVVAVIPGIEVAHGVVGAPAGDRLYFTNESLHSVDVIDSLTLALVKRIPLSGRPNNLAVTNDGKKVYAGIAQAPGAVDVIDTVKLENIKTVPVDGSVHNVYVTPDGKFAVSGSVASSVISVIDTTTDTIAWTYKETSGIRPMIFDTNGDGSTKRIFVQLSNYHGIAVVDWATRKEVSRFDMADIAGETKELQGLQAAPAHGLAITPDKKMLLALSKWYGRMYAYSLPDLKPIGDLHVGHHPEWLSLTPDGQRAYVAAAGDNAVSVVDLATLKETTHIAVGQVPKRNAMAPMMTRWAN